MIAVFVVGYAAIAFEHPLKINKTAPALLIGAITWAVYILMGGHGPDFQHDVLHHLDEHLVEAAQILFFLLGAMTIVEIVDLHDGFDVITSRVTTVKKGKLLVIICILTFFMSAALDNLTTSIVMVSLMRKLVASKEDRMIFLGMVIIAANAGGAWSPIGDVTTTMLWIDGQITAGNIISRLIVPSIVCLAVPLGIMAFRLKGNVERPMDKDKMIDDLVTSPKERNIVFFTGVLGLVSVPVFKTVTHLPPFMGMILALGVLWAVTEVILAKRSAEFTSKFSPINAMRKIDTPSVLFFLGILIAIGSLQATGVLGALAAWLDSSIGNTDLIILSIGLLSSIVDNVPLVAGAMGMYEISDSGIFAQDGYFWEFLAYAAGTGGSALIIGSAAGVAVMGMEHIDFVWYLKKISLYAIIGYFAGAAVFILMNLA